MNRKGFEEEGISSNTKFVIGLILFLVVLAVVFALLWSKIAPEGAASSASSFGKNIWDILAGGK